MGNKVHGRHGSRWAAVQGLYAWSLSGNSITQIEIDLQNKIFHYPLAQEGDIAVPVKVSFDKPYLHELLVEISKQASMLDEDIKPHIDRDLTEINPVEHAILRVAVYELKAQPLTPYRVIINEAILLAKEFGATDSHRFINGVLDKVSIALQRRT